MIKILIAVLLLTCSIFVFMQMRPTGKKLRTDQTKIGILNLEFAYNTYYTTKVLNAWKPDEKIDAAKTNTYIDFGFLFFYSLFLFYSCKNLSKNFSGSINKIGKALSITALIAGGLDVIENLGMLITLGGNQSSTISMLTAICASIKWLFAILAILYVIFISPAALYSFLRNKNQQSLK